MPPITERGGVRFDERQPPGFRALGRIDTTLNNAFGQDQLKSLRDVKDVMARQAIEMGANYIANFTYGQKNGSFLQQLWSVDNVLWYASGDAGRVD